MLVWPLALVTVLLVTPALFALILLARRLHRKKRQGFGRRPAPDPTTVAAPAPLTRKMPDWVVQEVLRLKALMGKQVGCRKVADTFNRLHAPTRVGKSFVSNTIRDHQYALLNIYRELRNKRPAPVSVNSVWGVDLTFVRDHCGTPRPVLGVVDHGSRVCTQLAAVVKVPSIGVEIVPKHILNGANTAAKLRIRKHVHHRSAGVGNRDFHRATPNRL